MTQPTFQTRILDIPSEFKTETGGTVLLTHWNDDAVPDLAYIQNMGAPEGKVRVAIASGASNYMQSLESVISAFTSENNGVWTMADFDRDGKPDLVYIKTQNTPNNAVEIHIATGATQFEAFVLQTPTPFSTAEANNGTWLMSDTDDDGYPDLVFIKTKNTPNNKVEVHVLSGVSNYQNYITHAVSSFSADSNATWLLADWDRDGKPDLVCIKNMGTTSGTVEVTIASGASNYQEIILQTTSTFGCENNGTWVLSDWNQDGILDLVYLKTQQTGTNKIEVHVASGFNPQPQILVQTQLLELYTKSSGKIADVRSSYWAKDNSGKLHAFVVTNGGTVTEYLQNSAAYTGWTANTFGGSRKKASEIQAGYWNDIGHAYTLDDNNLYEWTMASSTQSWAKLNSDSVHGFAVAPDSSKVFFDQNAGIWIWDVATRTKSQLAGTSGISNISSVKITHIIAPHPAPSTLSTQVVLEVVGKENGSVSTFYFDPASGARIRVNAGKQHSADGVVALSGGGYVARSLYCDLDSKELNMSSSFINATGGSGGAVSTGSFATNIVAFDSVANSNDGIDLFALNTSGELLHWVFTGQSDVTTPVVLSKNVKSFSLHPVGNGDMLEVAVVATNASSSKPTLFKATRAIDGLWRVLPAYFNSANDQLQTYPCFRTDVTVGDENGIPVAGETIYFLPNESDVEVEINGKVYLINADDEPLTLTTNAMGRATFTVNTSTLHTSQILVWTDFTGDRRILVEPNGPQQTKLRNIDSMQLGNAKKKNADGTAGTNLLPNASKNTPDLISALNETMALGESDADEPSDDETYLMFARNTDHVFVADNGDTARHARVSKRAIDNKHFTVSLNNGQVGFQRHTRETALATMATAQAAAPTTFTGSIDDVLQGALTGALQINSFTVSYAENNGERDLGDWLEAAFNFVMDGINYVVNGLIEFVRQAFAAVENIFAAIGVFFKDLFSWLGDLFAWSDILNTQTVIESTVKDALNYLPKKIANNRTYWDQMSALITQPGFLANAGNISNNMTPDAGIASSNAARAQDASVDGTGTMSGTPQTNWAMSLMADSQSLPTVTPTTSVATLLQSLQAPNGNESSSTVAAGEIMDSFFSVLYDQQGNITWATISAAVSNLIRTLGQAVLQAAGDLILSIMEKAMELINAVLQFSIEIPILTDVYASITKDKSHPNGKPLTILSLISLVMAIPATICYKLLSQDNVAPFTNGTPVNGMQMRLADACESRFNDSRFFPTGTLVGIPADPKTSGVTTRDAPAITTNQALSWVFGFGYGACYLLAGIADTLVQIEKAKWNILLASHGNPADIPGFTPWAGGFTTAIMLVAQSISCPWLLPDPYPTDPNKSLFWDLNIAWYLQWVISANDVIRLIGQVQGWESANEKISIAFSALGGVHVFAFAAVAGSDSSNHVANPEFGLKTTQNMLTAVGELAAYPLDKLYDKLAQAKQLQGVIAVSAVNSLLFYAAPGILNIARTALNLKAGTQQFDV